MHIYIYIYIYVYTAKLMPQEQVYKSKVLQADAAHGPRQEPEGSKRPSYLSPDIFILLADHGDDFQMLANIRCCSGHLLARTVLGK